MAVKASGTSLSFTTDIVGEFTGATPHSLSEYVRGGAYVPDTTANNGIPTTTSLISFSQFYSTTNIAYALTAYTTIANYSTGTSTAGIRIGRDGYIYALGNDGTPALTTYTQINTGADWVIPRSATIGDDYYIYATQTGDTMGGTFTTDLSLVADKTFTLSNTASGTTKTSAITLVLKDSGLTTLATRLYNLTAERG